MNFPYYHKSVISTAVAASESFLLCSMAIQVVGVYGSPGFPILRNVSPINNLYNTCRLLAVFLGSDSSHHITQISIGLSVVSNLFHRAETV